MYFRASHYYIGSLDCTDPIISSCTIILDLSTALKVLLFAQCRQHPDGDGDDADGVIGFGIEVKTAVRVWLLVILQTINETEEQSPGSRPGSWCTMLPSSHQMSIGTILKSNGDETFAYVHTMEQ